MGTKLYILCVRSSYGLTVKLLSAHLSILHAWLDIHPYTLSVINYYEPFSYEKVASVLEL